MPRWVVELWGREKREREEVGEREKNEQGEVEEWGKKAWKGVLREGHFCLLLQKFQVWVWRAYDVCARRNSHDVIISGWDMAHLEDPISGEIIWAKRPKKSE